MLKIKYVLHLLKNRNDWWTSLLKKIKHHKSVCIGGQATSRCITNVAHLKSRKEISCKT